MQCKTKMEEVDQHYNNLEKSKKKNTVILHFAQSTEQKVNGLICNT